MVVSNPEDREFLLSLIEEYAKRSEVDVHAFVLMGNHFHLLLTPHDSQGLAAMMQGVGRSYVRYFNQAYKRTGTLWEGRYKSTVIQTERYLLACMVYIDLNPVRAHLCEHAIDFPWSSHAHYVGAHHIRWIKPHDVYWALGNTPFARELAYRELVTAGISADRQDALTQSTMHGWALGDEVFKQQLQGATKRRLEKARPGRPTKSS